MSNNIIMDVTFTLYAGGLTAFISDAKIIHPQFPGFYQIHFSHKGKAA